MREICPICNKPIIASNAESDCHPVEYDFKAVHLDCYLPEEDEENS